MEVYFFVPQERVAELLECGLKLSEWADRVTESGRKFMAACLDPRDDKRHYKQPEWRCLRIVVQPESTHVADGALYAAAHFSHQIMTAYQDSMVVARDYVFGTYRMPECLIPQTLLPGQFQILPGRPDTPWIVGDAEDLYLSNLIENIRENEQGGSDALLYGYFRQLAQIGKVDTMEDEDAGIAVFWSSRHHSHPVVLKIPREDSF